MQIEHGCTDWSGTPDPNDPDNAWVCDGCGARIAAADGATDFGAAIWFEGATVPRGFIGQPNFETEAEAREWATAELKRRGIAGEVRS